jgi:hypothetical protein
MEGGCFVMFGLEKCLVMTTIEPKIKLNAREVKDELNMHNKSEFINQLVNVLFILGTTSSMRLRH